MVFLQLTLFICLLRKLTFFIETSGNSNSLDLESLILEVYTNGSITPSEAVSSAAEILQNIFCSLRLTNLSLQSQPILEEELKKEKSSGVDNILIEELELSVRAFNCLKRANIHTLSDLLQYSQDDLLEFKNFGQKSANEVCINLKNKFGKTLV
jgi:DNA-directed RNA polymerase subunit alpha